MCPMLEQKTLLSRTHSGFLGSKKNQKKRPESTASECVNLVECVAAAAAAVAAVGGVLIDTRDIHTSHQEDQTVCRLRSGSALLTRCHLIPPSSQKGVTGDYGIPPED